MPSERRIDILTVQDRGGDHLIEHKRLSREVCDGDGVDAAHLHRKEE